LALRLDRDVPDVRPADLCLSEEAVRNAAGGMIVGYGYAKDERPYEGDRIEVGVKRHAYVTLGSISVNHSPCGKTPEVIAGGELNKARVGCGERTRRQRWSALHRVGWEQVRRRNHVSWFGAMMRDGPDQSERAQSIRSSYAQAEWLRSIPDVHWEKSP
jgi:hypothetical protein